MHVMRFGDLCLTVKAGDTPRRVGVGQHVWAMSGVDVVRQ